MRGHLHYLGSSMNVAMLAVHAGAAVRVSSSCRKAACINPDCQRWRVLFAGQSAFRRTVQHLNGNKSNSRAMQLTHMHLLYLAAGLGHHDCVDVPVGRRQQLQQWWTRQGHAQVRLDCLCALPTELHSAALQHTGVQGATTFNE